MVFASAAGMTPRSSKQQALSALSLLLLFLRRVLQKRGAAFGSMLCTLAKKNTRVVYKFMPAAFALFKTLCRRRLHRR
jgi:hypothetical protein